MEKKKRRNKHIKTAVLAAGILFVLFASFHRNLSGDDILTGSGGGAGTTTVYNIHNRYQHNAIIEQEHHSAAGGPSLPLRVSADTPPVVADGVLFPDWEVLLLLVPSPGGQRAPPPSQAPLSCLFQNGATSPANFSGVLHYSRRPTYRCVLPRSVRRLRRFYVPRLIQGGAPPSPPGTSPELMRWNFLAYDSLTTTDDVIVFAKGVNPRKGGPRRAEDLRCVFHVPDAAAAPAVRTAVTSSSQEVFRCLHPDKVGLATLLAEDRSIRISLEIGGGGGPDSVGNKTVPSMAEYLPRASSPAQDTGTAQGRHRLCACTMVYNVAKFLPEWVVYHSRLGVEHFVLYDNGSEDDLEGAIAGLRRQGHNVSSLLWLWPKTQEASFSHCAAASRGHCDWMMYLDVDEFAFSPSWSNSSRPSSDMLWSILPSTTGVGQVSMGCYDFGPSNRTAHPAGGVTQGYTCRRRGGERHKSIVRLAAVHPSLHNVVHHFRLREGYRGRAAAGGKAKRVVVNHYKYQAWAEFKAKFRRRASAYVADWTEQVNPGSKDRTPGLGFSAVEPPGWAGRFCEVNDTRLRDTVRRWFGRGLDGSTGDLRMEWQAAAL